MNMKKTAAGILAATLVMTTGVMGVSAAGGLEKIFGTTKEVSYGVCDRKQDCTGAAEAGRNFTDVNQDGVCDYSDNSACSNLEKAVCGNSQNSNCDQTGNRCDLKAGKKMQRGFCR